MSNGQTLALALGALGVIIVVRVALASYWMHQEDKAIADHDREVSFSKVKVADDLLAQEREKARDQSSRFQERILTIEEKNRQRTQELAADNERLKGALSELEEAKGRVDPVRAALTRHADDYVPEDGYTPEKGQAWLYGADVMLQEAVDVHAANRFMRGPYPQTYADHKIAVASLRGLASNLRPEDLRCR